MKRLLCIVSAMNTGGAETFLMKIFRNIDKTKYCMDFCVNVKENYYESEIKSLGGNIYVIPAKSTHPIGSFFKLKNIVRNNKYDYVMRVNEHSLSTIDLIAAKLGGAKKLIMRSSNASSGSKKSVMLHKMFRFLSKTIPDVKIAPSELAAEYTFGKNCIKDGKAFLIHNAVDLDIYKYSIDERNRIRNEFNISDKYVLGHIGRFNQQKNHNFLLDIFKKVLDIRPDSVLMLVGKGELESKIKAKSKELGILNNIIFTGVRSDIPSLLSAMDVFVFPSLYEGMPNTVIEAQATGLPCIISDTVTGEANITKSVKYLPITNIDLWVDTILKIGIDNIRHNYNKEFIESGYEIKQSVKNFINLIFNEG